MRMLGIILATLGGISALANLMMGSSHFIVGLVVFIVGIVLVTSQKAKSA